MENITKHNYGFNKNLHFVQVLLTELNTYDEGLIDKDEFIVRIRLLATDKEL